MAAGLQARLSQLFIALVLVLGGGAIAAAFLRTPPLRAPQFAALALYAAVLAYVRFRPITNFEQNAQYGWITLLEFAALAVLPLPLALLAQPLSYLPVQFHSWRRRRRLPFLTQFFNAATNALALTTAATLRAAITGGGPTGHVREDLSWLAAPLAFQVVQTALVSAVICLDRGIPLRQAPTLDRESLTGDGLMLLLGGALGALYAADPYFLLLLVAPALLAFRTAESLHQARMARFDPKTGLYNCQTFDKLLEAEVQRSHQRRLPLSLVFADMDFLRNINNTYGHQAGDVALRAISGVFSAVSREVPGAAAARFGGEEFVLLLPGIDRSRAVETAEDLRLRVRALALDDGAGHGFSVTVSAGVATCPGDGDSSAALVKAADVAVYAAKNGGRNRVVQYHPSLQSPQPAGEEAQP